MKYRVIANYKTYAFDNYSEAMLFKHKTNGKLYQLVNWKK